MILRSLVERLHDLLQEDKPETKIPQIQALPSEIKQIRLSDSDLPQHVTWGGRDTIGHLLQIATTNSSCVNCDALRFKCDALRKELDNVRDKLNALEEEKRDAVRRQIALNIEFEVKWIIIQELRARGEWMYPNGDPNEYAIAAASLKDLCARQSRGQRRKMIKEQLD